MWFTGSEDVLERFQLRLKSHYQANVLADSVFLEEHFGIKLALLADQDKQINFDAFYHSTMDMLKEKICCSKEPFAFQNLLKFTDESQRCIVLLLGGAGYGKTHLCLSLLQEWASKNLHQQFKLVLYVPADLYGFMTFQDEADLLKTCFSECEPSAEVVNNVVSTRGANCLFIIDCLDKVPFKAFQRSLLYKIIEGSALGNAAVVVSARPSTRSLEAICLTFSGNLALVNRICS